MPEVDYHGWTHRKKRRGGSDPLPPLGFYEIKVFADANALDGTLPATATDVVTGDGKFIFAIPQDLDQTMLDHAAAFITTTGTQVQVQIRNATQAYDFLTTKITIDAGELSSYTAATPPVINAAHSPVATGDQIAVDVDVAGGKGLGVILSFSSR